MMEMNGKGGEMLSYLGDEGGDVNAFSLPVSDWKVASTSEMSGANENICL